MEKELLNSDKELLLKDLCARLPYGAKFKYNKNVYTAKGLDLIVTDEGYWDYAVTAKSVAPIEIDFIKPYLFPLSSRTEEQKAELSMLVVGVEDIFKSFLIEVEFYHKHHIDYRGLIEKSLAIDATGLNIY